MNVNVRIGDVHAARSVHGATYQVKSMPQVWTVKVNNCPVSNSNDIISVIKEVAGEQINSHTPVALVNNLLYKMDYSNQLHQWSFVGFTKTSGNAGDLIEVETYKIALQGWGLSPNTQYLAGSSGSMIISNNTTGTFTKVIGYAEDANTMLVYKQYSSINKI